MTPKPKGKRIYGMLRGLAPLLLMLPLWLNAQGNAIRKIIGEEGSGMEFVTCMLQDKQRYIWVGTDEGLVRFDGKHTKFFRDDARSENNYITASALASDGTIWLGLNNGGILAFRDGKFYPDGHQENRTGKIVSLFCDSHNTLTAFSSDGYCRISTDGKSWKETEIPVGENTIFSVLPVEGGHFLVGTEKGAYVYAPDGKSESARFRKLSGIPDETVYCYYPTPNKTGYLAGVRDKGIFLCTRVNGEWNSVAAGGEGLSVTALTQGENGLLYAGTSLNGIFVLLNESGTNYSFKPVHSTGGLNIQSLMTDHENQIWIGTKGDGLVFLTWEQLTQWTWEYRDYGREVNAIYPTATGGIWTATEKMLLFFSTPGMMQADKKFALPRPGPAEFARVTSLTEENAGTLWMGTESGLFRLPKNAGVFTKFSLPASSPLTGFINSLEVSTDGNLWVGTAEGLFEMGPDGKSRGAYTITEGLPHNEVRQIVKGNNGGVWVITEGQILTHIRDGAVKNYPLHGIIPSGLSVAPDGTVWIATEGQGLAAFHNNSLKKITSQDGLLSNILYQVVATSDNRVWTSHRAGYSVLETQTGKVKTYGSEHPLSLALKSNNVIATTGKGIVLSGTAEGIALLDPSRKPAVWSAPFVRIKGMQVIGRDTMMAEGTSLPSHMNRFRFTFDAMNSSSPEKLRYRYMLDGIDQEWSEFTENTEVSYPYLSPGKYEFKVQAINQEGIISETAAAFSFVILPPLWRRTWFITLMLALLVAGVWTWFTARTRRLRESNEKLERIVAERTEEIRQNKEEIRRINVQLERSLAGTMAKNDALVNAIPDLMLMVDRNGKLTDFRANELYDDPSVLSKFRGQSLARILGTRPEGIQELLKDVFDSREVQPFEFGLRLGGEPRTYEARVTRFGDEEALFLARDITERMRLEGEKKEQERLMSKAILETQENERKRFAEDLHDGLGQLLSASKMNLNMVETKLEAGDPDVKVNLDNLRHLLNEAIQEARGISHNLMPAMLKDFGLRAALEDLANRINSGGGPQIRLALYGEELPMDQQLEIALYRVIQEVINNALKHAKAQNISVQLNFMDGKVFADIEDDGVGFNLEEMRDKKKGLGLFSLSNRVSTFNGILEIDSRPGKGTLVSVEVPVSRTLHEKAS